MKYHFSTTPFPPRKCEGFFLTDAPAKLSIRPSIPGHATLVWSWDYWNHVALIAV